MKRATWMIYLNQYYHQKKSKDEGDGNPLDGYFNGYHLPVSY